MQDDDFFRDLDEFDEFDEVSPEWAEEDTVIGSEPDFEEDELDQWRRKSERASMMNDEMMLADDDDLAPTMVATDLGATTEEPSSGSSFSLGNFSAGQRLVLVILLLLNIIVISLGIIVVF